MAAVRAESVLHHLDEGVQLGNGHEVQRGAGKAAAMDAPCALAFQHVLGHGQRQGQALILNAGVDVLRYMKLERPEEMISAKKSFS